MFLAMNRFKIVKGCEEDFEKFGEKEIRICRALKASKNLI